MAEWFRFFLGTPRRFVWSFTIFSLVVVLVFPGLLRTAVERLVAELGPALGPLLAILIVLAGLRMMFRGLGGGGRRRR